MGGYANMPNPQCEALTFTPSMEQFSHLTHYMDQIESMGAHRGGICKIIPPQEWKDMLPSKYEVNDMVIPSPIKQHMHGQNGMYTVYNEILPPTTVSQLRDHSVRKGYFTPYYEDPSPSHIDRQYWNNVAFNAPTYGADVDGSLFPKNLKIWNVAHMGTLLDTVKVYSNTKIKGVNTSYLYFGTWRSTFPWHTEDFDLNSINYLHFGLPKVWYSVAPEHGERLERLLDGLYSGMKQKCKGFIRHKMSLLSPTHLRQAGIPYNKIVQYEGEFIITFPYGYHCGYNVGFNCAESTNFATERWIKYGKNSNSTRCVCREEAVSISMDPFVKLFQTPEEYKYWQKHEKGSPIDHTHCPPSPPPIEHYTTWEEKIALRLDKYNEPLKRARKPLLTVKQFLKPTTPVVIECDQVLPQPVGDVIRDADQYLDEDEDNRLYDYEPVKTLYDRVKERNRAAACEKKEESEEPDSSIANEPVVRLEKVEEIARNEDDALESVRRAPKHQNTKFSEETRLNKEQGGVAPYCSVCHVVQSKVRITMILRDSSARGNKLVDLVRDKKSRFPQSIVLIPEIGFEMKREFKMNKDEEVDPVDPSMIPKLIEKTPQCDVISPLLDCAKCNVRIHAKCWGLSKERLDYLEKHPKQKWRCDRCEENPRKAVCCFCNRIAGALKKVGNGKRPRWAHLECVLGTPGVFFENVERREGVNMSKLDKKPISKKSQCIYCKETEKGDGVLGHAVHCSVGLCSKKEHFHVTCARDNGHLIEAGDWPFALYLFCKECEENILRDNQQRKEEVRSLDIGEKVKVIADDEYPYQNAVVTRVKSVSHHQATFEDGSTSKDIYQEHIINHDWKKYPEISSSIHVKWSDGIVYRATYLGFTIVKMYEVKYEGTRHKDSFTRDELLDLHQYKAENQTKSGKSSPRKSKKKKKNRKRKKATSSDEESSRSASTSKSSVPKQRPPAKKSNGSSSRKKKKSKTPKEGSHYQGNGIFSD